MSAVAVPTRPTRTQLLDVLQADLAALDTAIISLRLRVVEAAGRDAFDLQRYVDEAVRRRAEVEAEIASLVRVP